MSPLQPQNLDQTDPTHHKGNCMKKNIVILFVSSALVGTPALVNASESANHSDHHPTKTAATGKKPEMVDAEVRKIDMDAKKITLKHAEIISLDMPGMTMVFQVLDAKILENVKPGDKVKFSVEQTKSGYLVTSIEGAK